MNTSNRYPLQELIDRPLTAVVFVWDYVQFQFAWWILTAVTNPTVDVGGRTQGLLPLAPCTAPRCARTKYVSYT